MAASLSIIALSLLAGSEPMAPGTAPRSEGVSAGVTAPLSVEPSALSADALANLAGGSEPSDSSADPSPISRAIRAIRSMPRACHLDTSASQARLYQTQRA